MQKMPRPTSTLSQLHNVGNDNGNSVNRTKGYTKLQVAVGTMTDMHHVLIESMGYSIVASLPCQHLFSNILSELHLLLLAQFQLSHTCIHPQLVYWSAQATFNCYLCHFRLVAILNGYGGCCFGFFFLAFPESPSVIGERG